MLNVCIRKHLLITYTLSYNILPQTSLERSLPVVNSVIIPLPGFINYVTKQIETLLHCCLFW